MQLSPSPFAAMLFRQRRPLRYRARFGGVGADRDVRLRRLHKANRGVVGMLIGSSWLDPQLRESDMFVRLMLVLAAAFAPGIAMSTTFPDAHEIHVRYIDLLSKQAPGNTFQILAIGDVHCAWGFCQFQVTGRAQLRTDGAYSREVPLSTWYETLPYDAQDKKLGSRLRLLHGTLYLSWQRYLIKEGKAIEHLSLSDVRVIGGISLATLRDESTGTSTTLRESFSSLVPGSEKSSLASLAGRSQYSLATSSLLLGANRYTIQTYSQLSRGFWAMTTSRGPENRRVYFAAEAGGNGTLRLSTQGRMVAFFYKVGDGDNVTVFKQVRDWDALSLFPVYKHGARDDCRMSIRRTNDNAMGLSISQCSTYGFLNGLYGQFDAQ